MKDGVTLVRKLMLKDSHDQVVLPKESGCLILQLEIEKVKKVAELAVRLMFPRNP